MRINLQPLPAASLCVSVMLLSPGTGDKSPNIPFPTPATCSAWSCSSQSSTPRSSQAWGDVSSLLENSRGILTKPRLCQTFPSQPARSPRIPAATQTPCALPSLLERIPGLFWQQKSCLQQWDLWLQLGVESSKRSLSPGQALGSGDGAR